MTKTQKIRENLSNSKKIIVKIGTNSLTGSDSKIDEEKIEKIVNNSPTKRFQKTI